MQILKFFLVVVFISVSSSFAQQSVYGSEKIVNFDINTKAVNEKLSSELVKEQKNDIKWVEPVSYKVVGKYERMEIGLDLPNSIKNKIEYFTATDDSTKGINPFLEWQFKATAVFKHLESGETVTRDGFYYNEFDRDTSHNDFRKWDWVRKKTPQLIRVRFAPPAVGEWTCAVSITTKDTSFSYPNFSFITTASSNKGYMKMGESKRFFKLGDETFFPCGQNMIAPRCEYCYSNNKAQLPSETGQNAGMSFESWMADATTLKSFLMYQGFMKSLAASGGNYFREILLPQSQDFEWEKLGNYYPRQNRAWELDEQVFLAEQLGLKIQLNLQIQISLERNMDRIMWNWSRDAADKKFITKDNPCANPYNREIKSTSNMDSNTFFSDETAKKFYKQKLRYIEARWGYSTSIGMWGMASEIQTPCTDADVCVSWMREMGSYMKDELKTNQLITPSFLGIFRDPENYENLIIEAEPYQNIGLNWYAVSAAKYQNTATIVEDAKAKFDLPFFTERLEMQIYLVVIYTKLNGYEMLG